MNHRNGVSAVRSIGEYVHLGKLELSHSVILSGHCGAFAWS